MPAFVSDSHTKQLLMILHTWTQTKYKNSIAHVYVINQSCVIPVLSCFNKAWFLCVKLANRYPCVFYPDILVLSLFSSLLPHLYFPVSFFLSSWALLGSGTHLVSFFFPSFIRLFANLTVYFTIKECQIQAST